MIQRLHLEAGAGEELMGRRVDVPEEQHLERAPRERERGPEGRGHGRTVVVDRTPWENVAVGVGTDNLEGPRGIRIGGGRGSTRRWPRR